MKAASNSPVKSPKLFFRCEISCKVWSCTTKIISISRCESLEIRLLYRRLSSRKLGNSTEFLLNTATIRKAKVNKLLHLTSFCLKLCSERNTEFNTRHYNAELQTTETLRATKYYIESTYSDLPRDWKLNKGKLALINHPWKCKKGKKRRSPLVHSRKLTEHDNFTRAVSCRYLDRGQEIGKYCPLPEPIRLQDSLDTARSRSKK